jgi:hypothetical protein
MNEITETVPKEVIEHYIASISKKEKEKYKKIVFYRIQNKIRNLMELTDDEIFQISKFDHDEKIILIKIANKCISALMEQINLVTEEIL